MAYKFNLFFIVEPVFLLIQYPTEKSITRRVVANMFFTKTCTTLQLKAKATSLFVVMICISLNAQWLLK